MSNNEAQRIGLSMGLSAEEIRNNARKVYDAAIALGRPAEEANAQVYKMFGFTFGDLNQNPRQSQEILKDMFGRPQGKQLLDQVMVLENDRLEKMETEAVLSAGAAAQAGNKQLSDQERANAKHLAQFRATKLPDVMRETERSIAEKINAPKEAEGLGEAFWAGWDQSVIGLTIDRPQNVLGPEATFSQKAVAMSGTVLGDLPTYIAGALGGGVAGSGVPVIGTAVGAAGGAMAFTEMTRAALMQHYERGAITTPEEFLYRTGTQAFAGVKGAAIAMPAVKAGMATRAALMATGAPRVAQATGQVAVETAAASGMAAALDARLPTYEDFALNGIMMGGLKLGGFYTSKLRNIYIESGQSPLSTLFRMGQDGAYGDKVRSGNLLNTGRLAGEDGFITLYSIRRNAPLAYDVPRGWVETNRGIAEGTAQLVNRRNNIADPKDPSSFQVEQLHVAGDARWLDIRTPVERTNAVKQYIEDMNNWGRSVESFSPETVDALWSNPNKSFQRWLAEGRFTPEGKNAKPIGPIDVVMNGNKMLVLNEGKVLSKEFVNMERLPIDEAAPKVLSRIATGLQKGRSLVSRFHTSYQMLVDRVQPLNTGAPVGFQTASYMLARMFSGVEGISMTWLQVGRTGLVQFTAAGKGFKEARQVTGASFSDIINRVINKPIKLTETEAAQVQGLLSSLSENTRLEFSDVLNGKGNIKGVLKELRELADADIADYITKHGRESKGYLYTKESLEKIRNEAIAEVQKEAMGDIDIIKEAKSKAQVEFDLAMKRAAEKRVTGLAKYFDIDPRTGRSTMTPAEKEAYIKEHMAKQAESAKIIETKAQKELEAALKEAEQLTTEVQAEQQRRIQAAIDNMQKRLTEFETQFGKDSEGYKEHVRATEERYKDLAETAQSSAAVSWINKGITDTLNLFRAYITAKHVKALAENNIPVEGMDATAARSIAENTVLQKAFDRASRELTIYQHALIDYRVASGLMSEKKAAAIKAEYPDFVPINYLIDGVSETGLIKPGDVPTGIARRIADPLEAIVQQTFATIRQAEKNQVMRVVAEEHGLVKAKTGAVELGTLSEWRALESKGKNLFGVQTIEFYDNGKPVRVQVPKEIFDAAMQLDPTSAHMYTSMMLRGAANVASVLRAGAVLSPTFMQRNFVFDQMQAYMVSASGYQPIVDFGRGLGAITNMKTGGKLFPKLTGIYNEWLRHGGAMASYLSQDRKFTSDIIDIVHGSNSPHNSVPLTQYGIESVRRMLNPLNWMGNLRSLSSITEEATRIGEFMRARQAGVSPTEAAYRSREVTVDFARIGASMKALNSISAFLNANIQGPDRMIRQIIFDPVGTASRVVGGVVVPTILLSLVQQDFIRKNPESEVSKALAQIPDWQRNTYWIVPSPIGIFRIPKPREFAPFIAGPIENFISYLHDKDPDTGYLERLMENGVVGHAAESMFLHPLTMFSTAFPTVGKPLVEGMFNYNTFSNTPILPPSSEKLSPPQRYSTSTSQLSKAISNILNQLFEPENRPGQRLISPQVIEHLVQGYTGTLGIELYRRVSKGLEKIGFLEEIKAPERGLQDLPLISAFVVKYPHAGSKSVETFFKDMEMFEQRFASIQHQIKEGSVTSKSRAEAAILAGNFGRFTGIRSAMSQIAGTIRATHYNNDLDPNQKREYIDRMYWDMITLAKGGNQIIKDMKRQTKRRLEAINADAED